MKILSLFGTRPEAIKMAPLVTALAGTPGVESVVCVTGQHRQMLDQVMDLFGLKADHDLAQPFPEEMNRRVVDVVSQWMFAPTSTSRANLLRENLQGRIAVTGNTVIDALATLCARLDAQPGLARSIAARHPWVDPQRRMLLVTGHRRENFGEGFQNICAALADLAQRHPDLLIVYPVHFNPAVREVVMRTLGGRDNIRLIDPLDYVDFVWFMQRAHIILTDSGGVQEEAPFLGKPVLVMRDVTERPEAVSAGTVLLVGTRRERIVAEVDRLLANAAHHASFARRINPYGDGRASQRIVKALLGQPFDEFAAGHTGAMAAIAQGMAPA
jgi:UDP-N-acetylglucosamine 2-epimerase (non-hydrolysing)